ncbi:MAG TPA: FecR domain-containing protein, partial [Chitinophaga sp.]
MHDKEFDHWLLIRFIDGTANETEQERVLAWINSDAANKELYFRVKDILDRQRATGISPEDISAQWQQVQQAMAPPRRSFNRGWMKYAAVFLLALSVAAFFFYRNNRAPGLILVKLLPTDSARMIRLPDSSLVWLGPGTELQYHPQMNEGREVWIKGTGYFDVKAQDARHAFLVHMQRMQVRVLGTSFVVSEDERRSSVVVSSGAVKVSAQEQEQTLRPNQRWLVEGGRFRKERVNAALYTAWKDDDPYFENTSLAEVAEMLSVIYGYTITIEKPEQLKGQTFSGRIALKDKPELWN